MKRFVLAITLACALSATALAGEVPTTGAPAPGETQTPPGDIPTVGAPGEMPMISPSILAMILDLAF